MTITNAQTVTTLALSIAADIEEFGHYQGQDTESNSYSEAGCCILRNPTMGTPGAWEKVSLALAARIGTEIVTGEGIKPFAMSSAIFDWNDRTPTAEVLDTLRSL